MESIYFRLQNNDFVLDEESEKKVNDFMFNNNIEALKTIEQKEAKLYKISDNEIYSLIIQIVFEHFQVSLDKNLNEKRNVEFVKARRISMYLGYCYTNLSLNQLGEKFSKDHATALFHIKKTKFFYNRYLDDKVEIDFIDYIIESKLNISYKRNVILKNNNVSKIDKTKNYIYNNNTNENKQYEEINKNITLSESITKIVKSNQNKYDKIRLILQLCAKYKEWHKLSLIPDDLSVDLTMYDLSNKLYNIEMKSENGDVYFKVTKNEENEEKKNTNRKIKKMAATI